jgi:hypothetical protein
MISILRVALAFALTLTVFLACASAAPAASAKDQAAEQRLSGPYTHGNLTIFLVHGVDTLKGDYLTLEEALAAEVVKVHETEDVNELAIENVGKRPVFVQSGDIVKGGKQDRCIGTDFTLVPKSGQVKIAAFCVEHGRWQQRGGESASLFQSSSDAVAGKALKLAGNANYAGGGGQQKVWDEVKANQEKLSQTTAADVAAPASPSSLQLTLENKDVREAVDKYLAELRDAPGDKTDVIGYAAVINGKLNCADVYGSHALFEKLWPRQLKSVATEAAAESKTAAPAGAAPAPPPVDKETVEAALRTAEDGKTTQNHVGAVTVTTIDSKDKVMFETRARGEAAAVRRSVITKD